MNAPAASPGATSRHLALRQLACLFLRLGTTAFGGPAAHISMMEDEVVRRRQWLTREKFLDLLGAANLIPGPNSTEMAIFIGHARAGWAGLVVAGLSFILPATLIVWGCAWAYVRYGSLPQVGEILYGVKPVIIAIVVQAIWSLARTAIKTRWLAAVAMGAAVMGLLGVNELLLLLVAGLVVAGARGILKNQPNVSALLAAAPIALPTVGGTGAAAAITPIGLWPIFWFFLKVGAVLYGSGYVLLAFLRADLVERWHWLTEAQLLDAIAVGQITPGPLFTTATFIGYLLHGTSGAFVATAGIFLPSFIFVAISGPLLPRLRASPTAGAFLDGVNVASLALMAVVGWQLLRVAVVDWLTVGLAAASGFLLIRYRVNSAWLVLGGAAIGLLSALWRV